jgi:peptidoglycan/xylan/chitin deacetylase (PgdA/CDA1 family)
MRVMQFRYLVAIFGGILIAVTVYVGISRSKYSDLVEITPSVTPNPTITLTSTPIPLASLKLPIIMFHYIEYVQNPGDTLRAKMDISPFTLNFQLNTLKENNYDTYFVKDIPHLLDTGLEPKNKSIILTFDDGYEDFYQNVFPLLKKYQLKATVYIIYNFIGRKDFMTQSQIQELIDSGLVEVGSHSLSHPSLSKITAEKAHTEIFESKEKLQNMFGIPIETFAYPGGAYNDDTIKLVKEAGYTVAVTTKPGITVLDNDLYQVHRLRPGYLTVPFIRSYFDKLLFK